MKLYFAPGACSLADHIALIDAGLAFDTVEVDIPTRKTKDGDDYTKVNPKGYVPALIMDDGALLTENVAILAWAAEQAPHLQPKDAMARARLVEMLAFIEAEIHKPFITAFFAPHDDVKAQARKMIDGRFDYLADTLPGDHILGGDFTTADAFLYVMLRWAKMSGMAVPGPLQTYFDHLDARPSVKAALEAEGLESKAT